MVTTRGRGGRLLALGRLIKAVRVQQAALIAQGADEDRVTAWAEGIIREMLVRLFPWRRPCPTRY